MATTPGTDTTQSGVMKWVVAAAIVLLLVVLGVWAGTHGRHEVLG
jgi:hypothetical protein